MAEDSDALPESESESNTEREIKEETKLDGKKEEPTQEGMKEEPIDKDENGEDAEKEQQADQIVA